MKGKPIDFPEKLCPAIAGITDGFSFAYMQEAFIAALLVVARHHEDSDIDRSPLPITSDNGDDGLNTYEFWRVMKEQVRILRDDMDGEEPDAANGEKSITGPGKAAQGVIDTVAQGKETDEKYPARFGARPMTGELDGKFETTFHGTIPVFSRRLTPRELASTQSTQQEEKKEGRSVNWMFNRGS
jgi:hypothetical protein